MRFWTLVLVGASMIPRTEALKFYDPELCFILDGFLGLYGLVITGMFIKERFFRTKVKEENVYSDLGGPGSGSFPLMRDAERGRNRRTDDDTYTDLTKRTDGEYKELPLKRERQRKTDQVYQGLSSATRDTYDSLQMQPLR
ncbi:T-cell surface glycoprotein CD3 zeta chain-like isoform X2 [Acanthochromis polyacanthus]|uniref:T-cell surface glycoprotein CD3 zeta chain-like isoform X2 n=1 Tax=Acanthochromis polyacanthus TaxID=80966 RepID=UPI002234145D|nr:T-cell surface glycoprotein CD3 zeta chain-like isoform X2 [Acanthochromis polyacanthus]